MKIDCWADFICPFCYIGETRMKKALRNLGLQTQVTLEFHAFELNRRFCGSARGRSNLEVFSEKYRMPAEKAKMKADEISRLGEAEGLRLHFGESICADTWDAHRLVKLAASAGGPALADRIVERLFEVSFSECRDLSDKELLYRIGIGEGLRDVDLKILLSTNRFGYAVRQDEEAAENRRISMVPYFQAGVLGIPGAVSVGEMERFLHSALTQAGDGQR